MLPSSRPTMGLQITIGGCGAPRWNNAGRSGYFYSSRALGRTPRRPRGAGEERAADAPPSALRESEEGPVSRPAAPGSLFSICSLPDSETIGVPHPEPGRGRRRGGSGDSVMLACLSSSEHGPGRPDCGPGQRAPRASPGPWQWSPLPAGPPPGPTVSRGWGAAELGGATGPQLPAYLLWEPSAQQSIADDLPCTSSGHPTAGKAGPAAPRPPF